MNRKGSFDDTILLVIILFVIGATVLPAYLMLTKVNTAFQESPDVGTEAQTILQTNTNRYVALFDGVFLVVFVMLALGSVLLASQVNTNPMFMPISIILYVLLIVVSAVIGNVYSDMATAVEGSGDFVIIPFVFNHLVQLMLGVGFLLGLVMYARQQ